MYLLLPCLFLLLPPHNKRMKISLVGSMALMDAGIPVREHVAGISVGLVSETEPSTGEIKEYRILTDILVRSLQALLLSFGLYRLFHPLII